MEAIACFPLKEALCKVRIQLLSTLRANEPTRRREDEKYRSPVKLFSSTRHKRSIIDIDNQPLERRRYGSRFLGYVVLGAVSSSTIPPASP
jgi:hypothetical protein